jgi:L-cysteine desulfidase
VKQLWADYIRVLHQQVVPALGCTEPIAVALASAECRRLLGRLPERITAQVSPNIYKNGMGVGVPGTGMVGLPAAAAIGAIAGDPTAGLEVLKNVTEADIPAARTLCQAVSVSVKQADDPLYAEVLAEAGNDSARVIIRHRHTAIVLKEHNGAVVYRRRAEPEAEREAAFPPMTLDRLIDFAENVPAGDIAFMATAAELNSALSAEGQNGKYGLRIGATIAEQIRQGLLADDLLTLAMRLASAASDARMGGAMLPAMSNSGSGNQGIAATMPVVAAAQVLKAGRERLVRALTLSHIVAIYIKSHQECLSALCAANTASMGAGAAITWLLGGDHTAIGYCIQNMIGDVSGIICDGAKASCSMKVSTAASAAIKAALMAASHIRVSADDGIVAEAVDDSIANLGRLSREGMAETDRQIVAIMLRKERRDGHDGTAAAS